MNQLSSTNLSKSQQKSVLSQYTSKIPVEDKQAYFWSSKPWLQEFLIFPLDYY